MDIDLRIEARAWHGAAACKDPDHDFFNLHKAAASKQICAECVVQEQCLYESMFPNLEPHGVWGGHDPEERLRMRRRTLENQRREYKRQQRAAG